MTKFQALPKENLFVWAFIPYRITEQGLIGEFYDNPDYRQELADVFAELGIKWKWQPITLENMHTVVEEVVASNSDYTPVVLNYCDGFDENDGYPGLSVIKLLEAKGIIFTGADSTFEYLSISKIRMKQALIEAGVATAPYEVISDINHIEGVCERLGTPLIVKPTISTISKGISLQSVVNSDDQIIAQVQRLLQGIHGRQFLLDSIFVERFINGPEFAVFLIGNAQQPDNIKVYPAMERVFHPNLPETERFLAYEREKDEKDSSFSPQEPLCRYQSVTPDLDKRLSEFTKRAFCALGGTGYARADIRMDKVSQELFVLEMNSNCSISSVPISAKYDSRKAEEEATIETSVGTILNLAGIPFVQVMTEIIAGAFTR